MERQIWKAIMKVIAEVDKSKFNPKATFRPAMIVKVWMWAVVNDRPVSWAVQQMNWPPCEQRWTKPSNTTMSRRLRREDVQTLLQQIEQRVLQPAVSNNMVWMIDGKPLVISGCSKDKQAGYGRAAGGKAKGYKIHAIVGSDGSIAQWRVAPMNKDERVMAQRMLKQTTIQGYLLADSNYDSNKLHATCDENGNLQMIARRRYGPGKGHGHRKQSLGRMRSKAILEDPDNEFGENMLVQRDEIERYYGRLTNWGGGLTHLPPWARTHRRVHRWIQAKLIANQLKPRGCQTTYVN
jgi:hypothetical protein